MVGIREWLLNRADHELISFDKADFEQESHEILEECIGANDAVTDDAFRKDCWKLLQSWQRDTEYLSSLNLHRIIAKHVRKSCRNACSSTSIERWVELGVESARLDGPQLANEIENAIRAAWKVRAPCRADAVSKFSEELSFESLDKFYLGLENLIGYPPTNSDFLELMKREHEQGEIFADQKGRDVDPKVEWNIVMRSEAWNIPGAGDKPAFEIEKREIGKDLEFYCQKAKRTLSNSWASGTKKETLIEAEVAALRLWTGPMHKKYAEVLRNPKKLSCPYVTTLHAINSGITKLARIWRLPASRKVYRGYRNLSLKELKKDAFQCVGGVEKCVLATTEDFNTAVHYSGDGAIILEIDVGQVNRGADVSWLSQFPHEREILFNALSNVEFVCSPQLRFVEGCGTILVYQVCVSANVKSKTLEEFVRLRKDLHQNLVVVLTQQARRMIFLREEGSHQGLIKSLGAECRNRCDCIVKEAEETDVCIFNEGAPAYVTLVEDAIMLPSRVTKLFDLALRWFKTGAADPAEVDGLQEWQLEALRTAFRSSQGPLVRTIVLEHVRGVSSLFTAESLDLGAVHKVEIACKAAKLLTLNPNLNDLRMEVGSGTAEVWEKVFKELFPYTQRIRVNGLFPAEHTAVNKLQHLELRNLGIEMAAMIAPALLFHTPTALTSLSLWGSPIGCTGAESLVSAFSGLQRLRCVDLRSCKIADRGCTGIARSLSALTELEDLNLAHNNVKDDGFNILASAIRTHGLARLKSVDMRCNDTQLPSLRCGRRCVMRNHLVSQLSAHGSVTCVAWSPGGDRFASGSYEKTIIIWDANTGEQVTTLKGHTGTVTSVAWRPGGDHIASASYDKTIIIWDAMTGEQVSTLKGHTGTVTSVAWRPRGDQIASASNDKTIIIWDAKTGDQISMLEGHTGTVKSVAWRPWGDQIASGSSDKSIIIWDAKTGKQIWMREGANDDGDDDDKNDDDNDDDSDDDDDDYDDDSDDDDDDFDDDSDDDDDDSDDDDSDDAGHSGSLNSVVWSPRGGLIVSASGDKTIIDDDDDDYDDDSDDDDDDSDDAGHSGSVNSVVWSPRGDLIVSASGDKTIIIWDAKAGGHVRTLKGHTDVVTSVSWGPRGDQIASASYDTSIIIWDAKTGDNVSTLKGHTKEATCVVWHPGANQFASGSNDKTIIIWDAKTREQVSTLEGHTNLVSSLAWRHGGDQIASSSCDKTVIIWNVKTGEQVSILKGHTGVVRSVAWRPGRDQIASGSSDKTIVIWDSKTGKQVLVIKGHSDAVTSVAWSPAGAQIASGSCDATIIIWDAKTGDKISTLKGHYSNVTSVAWSPWGHQIASGSEDNTVIVWDVKTGEQISTLKGHTNWVTSVDWRPGGEQIVTGSSDQRVIIWDAKTGEQVSTLKGNTSGVKCVASSLGGDQIASASANGIIVIWNAKTGEQVSTLKGHANAITSVAWRPGGDQIASASWDRTIFIWDAKTDDEVSTLKGHSDWVRGVTWNSDGTQIASASDDKTIIIWDAETCGHVSTLKGHTAEVMSVAWRPSGDQIVSGGYGPNKYYGEGSAQCPWEYPGEIIIWDAKTGDQISTLKGHTKVVTSVAWRPGGDRIASGSYDKTIIIWDAKIGKQISTLKGHTSYINIVAWSPEGDQIASGSSDSTIINWDTKTGEQVSTLKGHTGSVYGVAWSPMGDLIVSGGLGSGGYCSPGEIFIWDAKTGDRISIMNGHTKAVMSVAWCPGGDQIVSGCGEPNGCGDQNEIIIWDAKSGDQVWTLKGNTAAVTGVAWCPGGDQIASASYKTIITWEGVGISMLNGHSNRLLQSVGDHIASASGDNMIIIWDAKTGEQVLTVNGHSKLVSWRPGGDHIASVSHNKKIVIWDAKSGDQVTMLEGHTKAVTSVAWRPGGDQIASGSCDETIIIWDAKTGEQISTLKGHTETVTSVAWRPGGEQIASTSDDRTIIIWDATPGIQLSTLILKGHTKEVTSLAWRPWGVQLASASNDKTIIIWDAKRGSRVSMLKGHTSGVTSVAWSPAGYQIASGSSDNTIIIWDAKTGMQVSTLKGHCGSIYNVAWRPGGEQIASASDDETIIIWDAKTGNHVSTLEGHRAEVTSVAWCPRSSPVTWGVSGHQVVSGSGDSTRVVWNSRTGNQSLKLKDDKHPVTSFGCSSGHPIEPGSTDGNEVMLDGEREAGHSTLSLLPGGVQGVGWGESGVKFVPTCSHESNFKWNHDNRSEGHISNVLLYEGNERIKPNLREAESGAVVSRQLGRVDVLQSVDRQGNASATENRRVCAVICLCGDDESVDTDLGCQPPPAKKKKISWRGSQE